jgi:hypothetical protein
MPPVGDTSAFLRYVRGLPGYLRRPLGAEECYRRVAAGVAGRERSLAEVLEHGVFGASPSPYRPLFARAGIELGDALELVRDRGVDGALERLHDAGVYVTLDEFKGRLPIVRGGLTVPVRPEDFDNPRAAGVYAGRSGGSRGPARRLTIGFAHLEEAAVAAALTLDLRGLRARPYGLWRPVPPGHTGLLGAVSFAKAGKAVERWFSQYPLALRPGFAREYLFTRATLALSRRAGFPIPPPEHTPLERAAVVARWLAAKRAEGTPAFLNCPGSSGVRVCRAALTDGLDISGTVFRLGGEPLTEGKAQAMAEVGADAFCNYAMAEVGQIGTGCPARRERDDVHLMLDRVGVIQREREAGGPGGPRVAALLFTTLLAGAPKVMLNVESDDYGVLEERACGCPLDACGLSLHLHTIRSYEKLTSEGMNFVGTQLLALVEQVLPGRFGGGPSDYQLVEEERDGLPRVSILVSPRIGPVDEDAVVEAVLSSLGSGPPYTRMMANVWRGGGTLRVERREPLATGAAKVLPLHIVRR